MNSKNLIIILILNIFLISCSNDNNNNSNNFYGNWNGTITGDWSGTWSGTINTNKKLIGTVNVTNPSGVFTLNGDVDANGNLIAIMENESYSINIDFTGTFDNKNGYGDWIFAGAGIEGTWTGTKQ